MNDPIIIDLLRRIQALENRLSRTEVIESSTGAGTPGGSDQEVQFNDAGAFGGDARFKYDKTVPLVDITGNFRVRNNATFFPEFTVAESTFGAGAQFLARYSRGTLTVPVIVNNGDVIGAFLFQGYDGAAYQTAAFISATINGTPGANDMPGTLRFWTTPDGSVTAAEHLTIDQSGLSTFTQQTLGNEILRLTSTATNDDPRVSWYQNRVATTDATLTTIATVAVPSNTTLMLEAHIVARRTGGTGGTAQDGAAYVVRGAYKNVAGTATIIGAVNADFTAEDQAAWAATFNVSGGNVLIQVTGAANNNVTWHVTYKYYSVSS